MDTNNLVMCESLPDLEIYRLANKSISINFLVYFTLIYINIKEWKIFRKKTLCKVIFAMQRNLGLTNHGKDYVFDSIFSFASC